MGRRQNDGRGRLGGRTAGVPNKPLEPLAVWAKRIINKRRKQFEADLDNLEPGRRAEVLSRLLAVASAEVQADEKTPEN